MPDSSETVQITLPELYADYLGTKGSREVARILFAQSDWFCCAAEFDPKTGNALPQSLSSVLAKIANYSPPSLGKLVHDRLWRITEHSRTSVERLFHRLNEGPRREQALLPIHAVRELDATSFIKLSNRPGRNIREKLAGNPYLQAVRRFQSVDLPENRLLKAFVTRLGDLLELRRDCLGHEDELLPKIQAWLFSNEAQSIARWDNLPPNNTLLSHRDYRHVWDAWSWLQSLDDDITRDFSQLESRNKTMCLWKQCAQMWAAGRHLFAETPLLFDFEKFDIFPFTSHPPLFKELKQTIHRRLHEQDVSDPACLDLTLLHPRYATGSGKAAQSLPAAFLWQHWKLDNESVDIELFNSDAAYLHPEATSISSSDLFFAKDSTSEHFDRAARTFASKLRGIFKHDTLIWLAPDFLNDFDLEVVRRNLNARFPFAEPLPRSVAAAFEKVDYSKIKDSFPIVVIDAINGNTCVTKLLARFDQELKRQLPETFGFYWERHPAIIVANTATENTKEKTYDIITVDDKGLWHSAIRPEKPEFIDSSSLKSDPRIGQFAFAINLMESPVAGGIHLHALQQRAGDIPLWRDHIPELSIKVRKDGHYQRFHLVSRGTTVKPIRGKPVPITINEDFTLPAGRPFYEFPLFLGESADDLGFSARLDSPAFPLKNDVVCALSLAFEYGADEPYKLVFTPCDTAFPLVRATWRRTEEVIITDAPSPEYPTPMTWEDLRRFPDSKNGGTMNLIEKLSEASANLAKWTDKNQRDRIEKSIKGWCRFLVIQIWRDGRTASEDLGLAKAAEEFKSSLSELLASEQRVTFDVRFLECCMHKDAPVDCVQWIAEQVNNCNIREKRAIGFALGSVSSQWQKDVLSNLVAHQTNDALRVFAYAIWREQHFVEKFSLVELRLILSALNIMLGSIKPCPPQKHENDEWTSRNWVRATTEPLEFLLGLLRTRSSSNPEIKMLLQPHQKITKELAKQVERITEIVVQSNITLISRVQINLQKPKGERTPDLLYALRLYLTGDDGANAIQISSVSDSDND